MNGNLQNSHYRRATTRRDFFTRVGSGLAGVALAQMLHEDRLLAAAASKVDPMDPKKPDHPPTAKSTPNVRSVSGLFFTAEPMRSLSPRRVTKPQCSVSA